MTKKQMRKIAKQLCELEKAMQNCSDQSERSAIEKQILSISNKIFSSPDGLELMAEIDELVLSEMQKI